MDCIVVSFRGSLTSLLTLDVTIKNQTSPLMVALSKTTASLALSFSGDLKKVHYPTLT